MIKVCSGDAAFNDYDLSCFSYPSGWLAPPFGKRTPKLQELARGLGTELETLHGDRKELILVAHSLGGLIARQYILSMIKAGQVPLVTKLMLFAVPNTGAALAGLANTIPWDAGALNQLGYNSDILDILNEDWVTHSIESKVPTKYVVGGADALVKPESARPYFGRENVLTLIGHTHRSIVDATSEKDIRYAVLRQFAFGKSRTNDVSEILLETRPQVDSAASAPAPQKTPDPLFDLYAPKDVAFYVERDCDAFLKTGMASGHVWVTGPSGVGKTAALRHGATSSGWQLFQLMLGSYQGNTAVELLRAICSETADLLASSEKPKASLNEAELVSLLRRNFRSLPSGMVSTILIEEIPTPPGEQLGHFLGLILKVILSLEADDATAGKVQLAFSSIYNPREGIRTDTLPKITEKLQFFPFVVWSEEELLALTNLLAPIFKSDLTLNDKAQIVAAAAGSPRYIKLIFRRWRNGTSGNLTLQELLASVRSELV
jgi:hypothetical protein